MGLVDGVGILIAKLFEYIVDTLIVLAVDEFADDALESRSEGSVMKLVKRSH
jgi:hypothetical protein